MPKLNKITCSIELGPSNSKLKEYGAKYSDGHVETFIAVPDTDVPFSIHLASQGYVAPGLAFFVFMDGEYQCNRNRTPLLLPGEGVEPHEYETEFRVRQKEEKTSAGTFVVRDWTFAKLNRVDADKAPNLNPQFTNNVGTIEVIVLRCKAASDEPPPPQVYQSKPDPVSSKSKAHSKHSAPVQKPATPLPSELGGLFGLFDGACDEVDFKQTLPLDTLDGSGDPPGVVINQYSGHGVQDNTRNAYSDFWRPLGEEVSPLGKWKPRRKVAFVSKALTIVSKERATQDRPPTRGRTDDERIAATLEGLRDTAENFLLDNQGNTNAAVDEARSDLHLIQELIAEYQKPSNLQSFPGWIKATLMDIELMRQYTESLKRRFVKVDFNITLQKLAQRQQDAIRDARLRKDLKGNSLDDVHELLTIFGERIDALESYLKVMERPGVNSDAIRKRVKLLKDQRGDIDVFRQELHRRRQFVGQGAQQFGGGGSGQGGFAQPGAQNWTFGDHKAQQQYGWGETNKQRDDRPGWQQAGSGSWTPGRPQNAYQMLTNAGEDRRGGFDQGPTNQWDTLGAGDQKQPDRQCAKGFNQWQNNDEQSKGGNGANGNSKKWQDGSNNGWGNGADQNNAQTSQHGGTQKTAEHDFQGFNGNGDSKSKSGKSTGWGGGNNNSQDWGNNGDNNNDNKWDKNDGNNGNDWNNNNDDNNKSNSNKWENNDGNNNNNNGDWDKQSSQKQSQNGNGWGGNSKANSKPGNGWNNYNTQQKEKSRSARDSAKSESGDSKAYIKPYWANWNKPIDQTTGSNFGIKKPTDPRQVYNYPATPLPAIPKDSAKDRSYGIQASRGADYSHKCRRPIYIDSMEAPFAVFSFKYRSKSALEKILKHKIDTSEFKKIQEEAERGRLASMPKHKLVEELMKRRRSSQKQETTTESKKSGGGGGGGWNAEPAQESAGGDGWDKQSKNNAGNDGWGAQSNGSQRSQKSSQKSTPGWNNDKLTNSKAGGWASGNSNGNGNGSQKSATAW